MTFLQIFRFHKEELFRFIKLYTGEQPHRSIECIKEDNGFEADRQLDLQCQPSVSVREGHIMNAFTGLVATRAKTPKDTRRLLLELDQRAKRVEEVKICKSGISL